MGNAGIELMANLPESRRKYEKNLRGYLWNNSICTVYVGGDDESVVITPRIECIDNAFTVLNRGRRKNEKILIELMIDLLVSEEWKLDDFTWPRNEESEKK